MEFEDLIGVFTFFFFIYVIFRSAKATTTKRVPPNSAVIIDRNTHYYATKRSGSVYSLNPATDIVTTYISTSPVTQVYTNVFETHDNYFYTINYNVKYVATDTIDDVLEALSKSKRSIYDIINSAVNTVVSNSTAQDMIDKNALTEACKQKIEYTLEPFNIDFEYIYINSITRNFNSNANLVKFKQHVPRSLAPSEQLSSTPTYESMNGNSDPLDFKDDHKKFGVEYL